MATDDWETSVARRNSIQDKWRRRRRVNAKAALRRRVNCEMESDWARARALAQKASASQSMADQLEALRAEAEARQKERALLETGHASLENALKAFIDAVERHGWVKCPRCREDFTRLMESGLCMICDPPEWAKKTEKKKEAVLEVLDYFAEMDG